MSLPIALARRVARRAVVAATLAALSASPAFAVPKVVVVEPAHLDVGEVEPGQPQKFEWTLRNDGDALLSIEALEPTCYCTTGKADSWSIAPGTSTKVHVTVDPSDWVGDILKGVDIQTNDAQNKTVSLDVKMKVRPGIAVVPPELDFGAVPAQGAPVRTVDVKAGKERPFKVTSLATDVPFVTVEQDPLQTDDRVGVKLSVKIAAGVPAGPFATKIVVQTDDASRPRIEIPVRGAGPGGLAVSPATAYRKGSVDEVDPNALCPRGWGTCACPGRRRRPRRGDPSGGDRRAAAPAPRAERHQRCAGGRAARLVDQRPGQDARQPGAPPARCLGRQR